MNWNAFFGIACIISLTAPVAVILYHRYYKHRSLAALLIYYSVTLIYILMSQNIIPVNNTIRINFGILNNYLDVPLMLTALLFFCPNKQKQNIIRLLTYLFMRQVKFTIMHGKNHGRVMMLAAIFFSYACYALIYYFYYVQKTPYVKDTELIYFIATIISTLVMAIGLHLMNKRMKELQSLRVTRKELAMIFNS
jgi:hypothetical protein